MWDHSLREKNLEFLKGIDSGYFRYVAEIHYPLLRSKNREQRQRSATAIRMDYSLALETFCALLATAVQSPRFALGWMLRYKSQDLDRVIRKLYNGEAVHSAWPDAFTWLGFSDVVHRVPDEEGAIEDEQQIRRGFAEAWRRFAADFIDHRMTDEYNSLKHGLRARAGGFTLSVGISASPGEMPLPEAMTPPSGSQFGARFFTAEKIGGRRDWILTERSQNWVPENMIDGLALLSMSISNLVWFLRSQGGDSARQQLQRPRDLALFAGPWAGKLEFDRVDVHPLVTEEHLGAWTNEEVRNLFPER